MRGSLMTLLFLLTVTVWAQHEEESEATHETSHRHTLIVGMGHTHIPRATEKGLIVPSWALSYHYWFNHKWAAMFGGEMEIATYAIETEEGLEIERERPTIVAAGAEYRIVESLGLIAAFGREFETHESFWVFRFGMAYEIFATDKWDVGIELMYDKKEAVFDAWSIGLGIGRKF